ncbi:response regulator [Clostridium hydrogenum]|uniref:response regulator n=1 Tax=Clostridium hydrogenum TaxID=2855764 RepID=UPI001F426E5B|nr:response regulator [Clostridium hydrogenum]
MKVIIVENEVSILNSMKIILSKNECMDIIGTYTNSDDALKNIIKLSPDVVFLNVEMPKMNGIELGKKVMDFDDNIQIVFVSTYEKYALEAFKVNATNYILKPITDEDINITINRLLKNYNPQKSITCPKKNKITSLGYFKVYGNFGKEEIKWPTAKCEELFAYFVYMQGKEVDKWHLCDILWQNYAPKKAEHNLHNTIYRIKTALKNSQIENIINYNKGSYSINFKDFSCDLWDFNTFIKNSPLVTDKNIYNYEKIIAQYKGNLFGNKAFDWCMESSENLTKSYISSLKAISKYYIKNNIFSKAKEYLKIAIKIDNFDEETHEMLLLIYFHMRDKTALVNHYKYLTKILKEELDINPKVSTTKLYKNLLRKI